MSGCCSIIIMIIIGIVVVCILFAVLADMSEKEKIKKREDERRRQYEMQQEKNLQQEKTNNSKMGEQKKNDINKAIETWWKGEKTLYIEREEFKSFFSYLEAKENIGSLIGQFRQFVKNQPLELFARDSCKNFLTQKTVFLNFINAEIEEMSTMSHSYIMSRDKYGTINQSFYEKIKQIDKKTADMTIQKIFECYTMYATDNSRIEYLETVEKDMIAAYLWMYAMSKPFDVDKFNKAVKVYYLVHREYVAIEPFIAEIYATLQMGSKDVARDRVSKYIRETSTEVLLGEKKNIVQYNCSSCGCIYIGTHPKTCDVCGGSIVDLRNFITTNTIACKSDDLHILASAFMWMKAFDLEEKVLNYMLENKIQMSSKLQERLHSLSSSVAPPVEIDAKSLEGKCLEISSISWKDDEVTAFFNNLSFKEGRLTYPLALREEDQVLTLDSAFHNNRLNQLFEIIKRDLYIEYEETVNCELKKLFAISGTAQEEFEGVLAYPQESSYMGIFLYLIPIGKKLNIKLYTLYLPTDIDADAQYKQTNSLYKKLNPKTTMWETSIKDTMLKSIQKYLNSMPEKDNKPTNDGGIIEF